MKYNAVDDITQGKGKADYGISRQAYPLNNEGHGGKKGHGHMMIKKRRVNLNLLLIKKQENDYLNDYLKNKNKWHLNLNHRLK